jgi:hypothetical protein
MVGKGANRGRRKRKRYKLSSQQAYTIEKIRDPFLPLWFVDPYPAKKKEKGK